MSEFTGENPVFSPQITTLRHIHTL